MRIDADAHGDRVRLGVLVLDQVADRDGIEPALVTGLRGPGRNGLDDLA